MRKLVLLLLCSVAWAQNFIPVTAVNIGNGGPGLLPAGTATFQAVDATGHPISYRIGGGGQQVIFPTVCPVTQGALSPNCQVANTATTNPLNVCFLLTIKNTAGRVVLGGTVASGYGCLQPAPSNSWCAASSCNLDSYVPNIAGIPTAKLPPPTAITLGGVFALNCAPSVQVGVDTVGRPICGSGAGTGNVLGSGLTSGAPIVGAGGSNIALDTAHVVALTGTDINTSNFIVGLRGAALPALAAGYLNYTGSAWVLTNPFASPTLTGTVTLPVTGGTNQCLHVNTLGVLGGTGADCGTGGGSAFQVNNTPVLSSTTLNYLNSAVFNGLTFTVNNPSLGVIQLGAAGTLNNSGLTNSSLSVNTQVCALGSGCTIPFQTNGTNNASTSGVNFITSTANAVGLVVTPVNATNQERFEISGSLIGAVSGTGLTSNVPVIGAGGSALQTDSSNLVARTGADINTANQVTGLRGAALPTLAAGYLSYTGSAWTLNSAGAFTTLTATTSSSPSTGFDIKGDGVPFTSGTTTPTVSATTALNAMLAARCPAPGTGAGCLINVPANTNILLTAPAGTQAAIPIPYDGAKFRCMAGHAPQYTAAANAASCKIYIGTAGLYAFSTGQLGLTPLETVPSVGPSFEGFEFYDSTPLHNAGGALIVMDTNKTIGRDLAIVNGFRGPAVNPPAVTTCTQSNSGGTLTGSFSVKLRAWTTGGASLTSAAATCSGTAPAGSGSISAVIPSAVAPVIGFEALCSTDTINYFTCSPIPTYSLNGDGSQNIILQTASPLVVSAPASIGTRKPVPIDLSHSTGFVFMGSQGWAGKQGFSNGQYFENVSCTLVQGCMTADIGSATVTFTNLEVDACDVAIATGLCAGSATPANGTTIFATPGAVIGTSDLRLNNVHGTGFSDASLNSSSGCMVALTGFNNQIMGGTLQSGGVSIENGVCEYTSTNADISGLIVSNYNNCFTADAGSKNNYAMYVTNGTCNNEVVDAVSPANGNQWINGGRQWTVGKSWAFNMANLVWSGVFPSIAAGGCGGSAAALNGTPSGTIAFGINTGTTPGTTCTITMPTSTGSAWACNAYDSTVRNTADGSWDVKPDPSSTTSSLVLKFFAQGGTPTAPPANNVVRIQCAAY
jgi:hypothetical protein